MPRTRIYDQATLCGDNNCCPVIDKDEKSGKITISDPSFPDQGAFVFKDEAEARTFFENAPAAFAAHLSTKKA